MAAQSDLEVRVRGRDELSPTLSGLESKLIRFVGAVSSALTAIRVVGFPVQAVREFEKQMANVQKTTGFADTQIKSLGDSLVDLSRKINMSATDLGAIAAAAGQQGLGREGVEGILAFTESVSRMAAVLDITAEQAGTDIGKIASIFKVPLREVERAVSAFNESSNNSTASGEQLLDVVKRIGDAAGSLDLAQSIGLGATGIDIGLSPEVVGTSFSKVMSEMYAQADKFADLLGISVEDWVSQLQTNGIDALKMYLARLRELTPQAQQEQIKLLSGGGRIGVAVTKLVRDTEDAILDFNVGKAAEGYDEGISALKEQLTVLQTLDAEVTKTGNSFQALGVKAGEEFAARLAGYMAQLNTALADEDVVQFAKAVGAAFGDMFDAGASLIKFLDDLNVNWTNFVRVGTIFVGLKLAQALLGMVGSATGLSTAWTRLATSSVAAGEAQQRAAVAGSAGLTQAITLTKELIAQQKAKNAAIAAEAQARQAVIKATADQAAANLAAQNAQGRERRGLSDTNAAGAEVTAAKSKVAAAEAAAAAQREAVNRAANQRIERANSEHATRIAAIEQERIRLQSIARANGDRSAVLAATRARNDQLAQEEAFHRRSLTSINAYYARRLTAVQAAGVAEVSAARLGLMQSLGRFDAAAATAGLSSLTTQSAAAAAALTNANTQLANANAQLTLAQRATAAAATGFAMLGTAVRVVGVALNGLLAVAGKAFLWLTLIYTALDALKLTDKLGDGFTWLTDAMGLTSEASRKLAALKQTEADNMKKAADAARDNAKALDELLDATTGLIDPAAKNKILAQLGSEDIEVYNQGVTELVSAVTSARAKLGSLAQDAAVLPVDRERIRKETDEAVALLADRQRELEKMQKRFGPSAAMGDTGSKMVIQEAQEAYDTQLAITEAAQKRLARYSNEMVRELAGTTDKTKQSLEDLNALVVGTFSKESAEVFTQFAPQIVKALSDVDTARKEFDAAAQRASEANGTDAKAAADEEADAALRRVDVANRASQAILQQAGEAIARLKEGGGLSEAVVGSLDALKVFFSFNQEQIAALHGSVLDLQGAGAEFTASLASPKVTPASGGDNADTTTDAEMRRQRRARIDLAKAELQSIANLEREALERRQAQDEEFFDRNLITIRDYYDRRRAVESSGLDIELKLQRAELAALTEELTKTTEQSEKDRTQAQIVKAQGSIDLLLQQRQTLAEATDREMEEALRDFADRATEQRAALNAFFGDGTDMENFNYALQVAEINHRDTIERMEREAQENKDLLPIVEDMKLRMQLEAVEEAMASVSASADLAAQRIQLVTDMQHAMADAGRITQLEAEKARVQEREALAQVKLEEAARYEALMEQAFDHTKSIDEQSMAYQRYAQQIATLRGEAAILQMQLADVAVAINRDITGAFSDAIVDITSGGELSAALTDMLLSSVRSMQTAAADALADMAFTSISGMMGESIGGMFAGGLGLGGKRGESPASPMYVLDATSGLAEAVPGAEVAPLTGGVFSSGIEALEGGLGTVKDGVTDALTTGWDFLSTIFMQVGTMIVTALGASTAASSSSSLIGAIGSGASMAAMAHGGAVIGRTTMSRSNVNPAIFADAVRYHTGTTGVGLKANEVPAILEKGETVRTEEQERMLQGALNESGGGGGDVNVWVVSPDVQPSMGPRDVIATVAEDISRGGNIRKVIATIPRR